MIHENVNRNELVKGKSGRGVSYSGDLKSFALTMQFYSTKAYDFVRKQLGNTLPHRRVIRNWYSKLTAGPGFTKPAFDALEHKVETSLKDGRRPVVTLMQDEMAIKKHMQWTGSRFVGHVDIGNDDDPDTSTELGKQ